MSNSDMQTCSLNKVNMFENITHWGSTYLWPYFVKFFMFVKNTHQNDSDVWAWSKKLVKMFEHNTHLSNSDMQACSVKKVYEFKNNTHWGYSNVCSYFVKYIMFMNKPIGENSDVWACPVKLVEIFCEVHWFVWK